MFTAGSMYKHTPSQVAINLNRPSAQFAATDTFAERLEFYLKHGSDKEYDAKVDGEPQNKVERKFAKTKKRVAPEKHEQLKKILEFESNLDGRVNASLRLKDDIDTVGV